MESRDSRAESSHGDRRPLLLVASEREGLGLVRRLGLVRDAGLVFPGRGREEAVGFYRGELCDLAITGVLEHNATAATALALRRLDLEPAFVVNFGAAGCYDAAGETESLQVGDTVMVHTVHRFDVDDNLHWAPPVKLTLPPFSGAVPSGQAPPWPVPPVSPSSVSPLSHPVLANDAELAPSTLRCVHCVTGSRYSTDEDRRSVYFPSVGQVEDMELYALAVLLQTLRLPLLSLKFVTNVVAPDGREQIRRNIDAARKQGEDELVLWLEACRVLE